ncbi:hypothetical protein HO173_007678 [Letharia columbiana]|uniref:Uncharacterized protein n=1 Tax=Letharia columbiana TaxID=112416 RepID=A0A8H6L3J1_9LECA|nr:uncharacterized protein HO173_007678 [Letharia columbiana]KAF6234256.1 hypothetical protein HO173_007678 [Letharia columbiana]
MKRPLVETSDLDTINASPFWGQFFRIGCHPPPDDCPQVALDNIYILISVSMLSTWLWSLLRYSLIFAHEHCGGC